MKRKLLLILLIFITFVTTGQNKMKKAEELIDKNDPGWVIVKGWIKTAKNKVEILPVNELKAKEALFHTQVTTSSPMGAICFYDGRSFN